jgi:hypothetical protein
MLRTRFGRWGLVTTSSSFSFRLFPWVIRTSPLLCKGRSDWAEEVATESEGNKLCLITSVDPELEDSSPPAKLSFLAKNNFRK